MKNRAYYHIYLPDDYSWANIFTDQMERMIGSGLVNQLEKLVVTAVGFEESCIKMRGLLEYYSRLLNLKIDVNFYKKVIGDHELGMLDVLKDRNIITETETLSLIHNDCVNSDEEFRVMYFHAKGVTSIERLLKQNLFYKFVNTVSWRKHLDWCVFDKYNECFERLEHSDAVGTNFCSWPSPHFSGNYWWTKSSYIKTLKNPKDQVWWAGYKQLHPDLYRLPDRLVAEMWIGSGDGSMSSLYYDDQPPPVSNLGEKFLFNFKYV